MYPVEVGESDRQIAIWRSRLQHSLLVLGVLALFGWLAGCQRDSPQGVFEEYLVRVARVVEATADPAPPQPLPRYPERRALVVDVPQRTIDVVSFFELHGCDMGGLVGYRNSPLGRLQSDSQRLGYEAEWLAAADACGADADEWMSQLGADKRGTLPALFWNATFAADEMRAALGLASRPAHGDLADLLRGLNDRLTALEAGEFEIGALERLLGSLRQGSWAGPARRDWAMWRRHLDAVSALLDEAQPRICLNRQPTPRSRVLDNVFRLYYVEQIQPELAVGMRAQEAWILELERLSGRLADVQPEVFRTWFAAVLSPREPASEWRRTQAAVVNHANAWQRLFTHCGLEPGAGLGQH
jgi:hypothetical protein